MVAGSSVQASTIQGGVHIGAVPRPRLPAPAQLPAPGLFTGRDEELAALGRMRADAAGTGRPGLVVVTGQGGVGKTALALHWLHQIGREYEGQLFVDLRGFSSGEPLPPGEPLERFLRALGAAPESIPVDTDEQAALFRSMTAGRPLVLLLDNAVSAAQVRPLLPGSGPALTVVTTRRSLSGLVVDGASFLDLQPLSLGVAVDLLAGLVGRDRTTREGEAVRALVGLCGLLPLAVCASGARLAAHRRWPIARLVAELRDEARRLATLRTREGDMAVDAVFNASYRGLDPAHARAYRMLGHHPGTPFDLGAAAALINVDGHTAAPLLHDLVDASLLLEDPEQEIFDFHDLIRLHARAKAAELDSRDEHAAAFRRLVARYLDTAVAADLVLLPGRWHLGERYGVVRPDEVFPDRDTALTWLVRMQPALAAVTRQAHASGLHPLTWQLCEAMWPLFVHRKPYRTWIELHRLGAAAAEAAGDDRARARMLIRLGMGHLKTEQHEPARDSYQEALVLARRTEHRLGEASALEGLGIAALGAGDAGTAADLFAQARDVHAGLARPRGVALMRRLLGGALSVAGRHEEALTEVTAALETFGELSDGYHQVRTRTVLGQCLVRAGRDDAAVRAFGDALVQARDIAAPNEEAELLWELGLAAARRGDTAAEREFLTKALELYTELDAPKADAVRRQLGETTAPSTGPPPAPDEPARPEPEAPDTS